LGDERLSDRKKEGGEGKGSSRKGGGAKNVRRKGSSDLGRALRSVYDDTLREPVPDDFRELLGKLH